MDEKDSADGEEVVPSPDPGGSEDLRQARVDSRVEELWAKSWRWVLAAAVLLWLAVALPMAFGESTFFVRDVFSNHLPHKAFGAEQLRQGHIPAFNPDWGLGHVHRGNPSVLAFYPDNVLYLLLPFWSAYNLHFALHWLLALVAMMTLGRVLGQSRPSAALAGITYAGCGWLISTLSFYNLLVVAAWWPLVMAGAVVGGRRGVCWGGLACGMALLGGEPITAALGLLPLLVATVPRHGWRRAVTQGFAIGAMGLLIALPQIVATARIYGISFRGGHGNIESQVVSYYLMLPRLVELILPLPFGWPGFRGPLGVWHAGYAERLPFFMSIHFGIVALALALAARRRGWGVLAASSLLIAWLGGQIPGLLDTVTFGLFRFPEKFLFWLALSLPLLAGWGLDRLLLGGERWVRWVRWASAAALALSVLIWALRPAFLAQFERAVAERPQAEMTVASISTQTLLLAVALMVMAILLFSASWGVKRRRQSIVLLCQLLALVQLAPLIQTDATEPYKEPAPWEQVAGEGAAVLATSMMQPAWHRPMHYPLAPNGPRSISQRLLALDLHPTPGVLHGLSYPFALNLEGMNSALSTFLEVNLQRLDWPQRVNWFRTFGLDYLVVQGLAPEAESVTADEVGLEGLDLVDTANRAGQVSWLLKVQDPAPEAWWPAVTHHQINPREAVRWVSFAEDPVTEVATAVPVEHHPGGSVRVVESGPDRIVLDVTSTGGVAVVRRAFQPLFTARDEAGNPLRLVSVNLLLLGVEVPPGEHRVTLAVSSTPELIAGAVALLTVGLAWVGGIRRRPLPNASEPPPAV